MQHEHADEFWVVWNPQGRLPMVRHLSHTAATQESQAERLFAELRKRAHTYLEMEQLGISSCPWKRLKDGSHYLRDGEELKKGERNGLVTYRIVKKSVEACA